MQTKWIKEIAMIAVIAIFTIGCTPEQNVNTAEQAPPIIQTRERLIYENDHLEIIPVTDSTLLELHGFAFGIENPNIEIDQIIFSDGVHRLVDTSDTLVAHIANGSEEDLVFILKLFINYEEIPFYVEGETEADTEYVFLVPALHSVNIPFQLDTNIPESDYSHKLTVGIFQSPHLNASEDEELIRGVQIVLNYELIYGEGGIINLKVPYIEANNQIEWPLAGLGIGNVIDPLVLEEFDHVLDTLLPTPLQVRRGEVVELAFLGNPVLRMDEKVDDYIILMMLDWHQIHPNGYPYLLIKVNDSDGFLVDHDTFTFLAPEETGLFEFVAIMIPNPTQENTINTFFPLEIAPRFTIEVVE